MPPYRTTSRRQYRRDVMGVVDDPSHANLQQLSTGRQITPGALRQNSKDVDATCGRDVRAAGPTNNLRSAEPSMSLLPPFRPCSPKPNEITATGGAHRRERARCGPDRSEPGPANSPPDYAVRGRLKCAAGSDLLESTSRKEASMSSPND